MSAKPSPAEVQAFLAKRELARRHMSDFVMFTKPDYMMGWVHRKICAVLDQFIHDVAARKSPRVMIFMPPRHGKSQLVSRHFPAFALGQHPEWDWITASYGAELPRSFSVDVRALIQEPNYQHLFPGFKVRDDANAMERWVTTSGGKYLAAGVGGGTTGMGAAVFDIDDPIKDMQDADSPAKQKECWEWYNAVAMTRLAPGGGILLTQTLWSLNDTSMRLLDAARQSPDAEQWTVYKFPAIATDDEPDRKAGEALHPERYPLADLERKRATYFANGQARTWHALYQQNPVPDDGAYFKKSDFRTYTTTPEVGAPIVSLDAAFREKESADRTAIFAWGESKTGDLVMLPGGFVGRCDTLATCRKLLDLCKATGARVIVAGKDHIVGSIGPHLRKMMAEERLFIHIEEMPEKGDKISKARSFQARHQMGRVLFPYGSLLHDEIMPEMLAFPAGRHDDIVDACAKAAQYLERFWQPPLPDVPKPTGPDYLRRGPPVREAETDPDARLFGRAGDPHAEWSGFER